MEYEAPKEDMTKYRTEQKPAKNVSKTLKPVLPKPQSPLKKEKKKA